MSDLDAIHAIERSLAHLWEKPRPIVATVGLPNGVMAVIGRIGYYWVLLYNNPSMPQQAYWSGAPFGLHSSVMVEIDPNRSANTNAGAAPLVIIGPVSATTHLSPMLDARSQIQSEARVNPAALEWGRGNVGVAALSIYERAIVALRAQAQDPPSLYLDVMPGPYLNASFAGGVSPVFAPPASGIALHLLYLDSATGTLMIVAGTAAVLITDALTLPATPAGGIPLAAVMLHHDDTAITEDMIYDWRQIVGPDHAPVTLGAGNNAALALVGQQLTLTAAWLTAAAHTAIGDSSPHHAAMTLDTNADTLLSLSTQQLTLDAQAANKALMGPTSGGNAAPTFRSLGASDLPALANHDHSGDAGDGGLISGRYYPLATAAASMDWDGDAKNGASGVIDLSVKFGLPANIKAVMCRLCVKDETAGVYVHLGPTSSSGYALDVITTVNGYPAASALVPCDANGDIYFTQGDELDEVYLTIWGYIVP